MVWGRGQPEDELLDEVEDVVELDEALLELEEELVPLLLETPPPHPAKPTVRITSNPIFHVFMLFIMSSLIQFGTYLVSLLQAPMTSGSLSSPSSFETMLTDDSHIFDP